MRNIYENCNTLQYRMTPDKGSGSKIDKCLYELFCQERNNQIPSVSEPMLKSKALEVGERLKIKKSKLLTDRWLEHF